MKIPLSKNFLNLIKNNNFKSLIKIITIKSNSTLISIHGKQIEIPFVLKKNTTYIAAIENGVLKLSEKKGQLLIKQKENIQSFKELSKILDSLFLLNNKKDNFIENEIKEFPFYELYSKVNNNVEGKNKKKYYFFNNKKSNEFFFIFNLPFFNQFARVFIKITNNKYIFLNIYTKHLNYENNNFIKSIKNSFKPKIYSFAVNITDNEDEFYNSIYMLLNMKNVDIKI
ncbi:MAG: hypothetical protein KAT05_14080 [Spirochaetes bacterium]|nr:hypothetical protein [Spirochaetota bacterium]